MKVLSAAIAASCFLFVAHSDAQSPTPETSPPPLASDGIPTASIMFPNGRSLQLSGGGGRFPLVSGIPGQNLTIQCRIPPSLAPSLVILPLDGGKVTLLSPPTPDGLTTVQFQPKSQPGLYRVMVALGTYTTTLQFWIPNPEGDNPATLTPQ